MVLAKLSFSATCFRINGKTARGCRLVWSRLVDLGSIDPGSNPGSPIILIIFSVELRFLRELHVSFSLSFSQLLISRRRVALSCFPVTFLPVPF